MILEMKLEKQTMKKIKINPKTIGREFAYDNFLNYDNPFCINCMQCRYNKLSKIHKGTQKLLPLHVLSCNEGNEQSKKFWLSHNRRRTLSS